MTASSPTWSQAYLWRFATNAERTFRDASVNLPTGALIVWISAEVDDTADPCDVWNRLATCPNAGDTCTYTPDLRTSGVPGRTIMALNPLAAPITVNNNLYSYQFWVRLDSGTIENEFRNVNVGYRLQVSPAPATATFGDVPSGHPFFQYIEVLAASDITAGCGGGDDCPDAPVMRGQMAVSLSKALGLHWPD